MHVNEYQTFTTDVLVIGAGGAGLRAAIELAQNGAKVVIVGKEVLGAAHTCMAEGGLNVALQDVNPLNSPAIHYHDTMHGGAWLNNQCLVDVFTREVPDRIRDLESYGVIFDRSESGQIAQRFSGKQTHPHTIFVGDYTGQAMMVALVSQIRKLAILYFDEHFVTRLFTQNGQVCGALALDIKSGTLRLFQARSVILATGGGGRMYLVSTNAASNTADGYAMALQIGCDLVDMEMVQFHPTGMVFPASARGLLVTESVRGEGGLLVNRHGERFMTQYNPERMELAGRDEVARAIYKEVQAERGTENGGVYLDVSHLEPQVIEERLPKMLSQFLNTGVDIRREPMEVHPTMHHIMGGVRINEWGETGISGLYAVGEVAGGIHGGNRLGGNAIAECQVFGRRAALAAAKFAQQGDPALRPSPAAVEDEIHRIYRYLDHHSDTIAPHQLENRLQQVMWSQVGIMRDAQELEQAQARLAEFRAQVERVGCRSSQVAHNRELLDCLELDNMLIVAQTIVKAALWRKESRGAHFRIDYSGQDDALAKLNSVARLKEGQIACDVMPVVTQREAGNRESPPIAEMR